MAVAGALVAGLAAVEEALAAFATAGALAVAGACAALEALATAGAGFPGVALVADVAFCAVAGAAFATGAFAMAFAGAARAGLAAALVAAALPPVVAVGFVTGFAALAGAVFVAGLAAAAGFVADALGWAVAVVGAAVTVAAALAAGAGLPEVTPVALEVLAPVVAADLAAGLVAAATTAAAFAAAGFALAARAALSPFPAGAAGAGAAGAATGFAPETGAAAETAVVAAAGWAAALPAPGFPPFAFDAAGFPATALLILAGAVGSTSEAEVPIKRPAATCVSSAVESATGIIGVSNAGFSARPPTIARLFRFEGFWAEAGAGEADCAEPATLVAAAGGVVDVAVVAAAPEAAATNITGVVATASVPLTGSAGWRRPLSRPLRPSRRLLSRRLSCRPSASALSVTTTSAPRGCGWASPAATAVPAVTKESDSGAPARLPFFFLRFRLLRDDDPGPAESAPATSSPALGEA